MEVSYNALCYYQGSDSFPIDMKSLSIEAKKIFEELWMIDLFQEYLEENK